MEKLSKVSLVTLALMLSIFLVAGSANALCSQTVGDPLHDVNCGGCQFTSDGSTPGCIVGNVYCYECGDVVYESCILDNDLADHGWAPAVPPVPRECSTRHGLIIGAARIAIDSLDSDPVADGHQGYTIDGGNVATRNCEVWMITADESAIHPCRAAADTACRAGAVNPGDCCIDSGILNARGTDVNGNLAGGCNPNGLPCQGGCDNVTIRNLRITNWCDGIFMSGDCDRCTPGTRAQGCLFDNNVPPVPREGRLTGILIEGNIIHDNGKDCGVCGGSNCDYAQHNYNDGIYLTEAGVNATNCVNRPLNCEAPCCDPCIIPPVLPHELGELSNIVRHNKIYNQEGCCCESCPGGNCVNVDVGLEVTNEYEDIGGQASWWYACGNVWYGGCNEIAKNLCKNTGCSCVQFHHGQNWTRIHGNYCMENGFAGIGSGCDWLGENYIYNNIVKRAKGPGIGVNSPAHIWNNISAENENAGPVALCVNYPGKGDGILIGGGGGGACIWDNTCCVNREYDIEVTPPAIANCGRNMCMRTNQVDCCQYPCCPPFFSLCHSDVNVDGARNMFDWLDFKGIWVSEAGMDCCGTCPDCPLP